MKKFDYTFKALWTECQIIIVKENDNNLNKVINKCYEDIKVFEQTFSRFLSDSILNELNRKKSLEVWEDFLSLLHKSKEIFELTNGYFNPLVNIEKTWYSSSFEKWDFIKVLSKNENLKFLNIKIYWDLVELEENMSLDFWSIAKWYLAQKISDFLAKNWIKNHLVNLGWDIFASWKNLENKKWSVWIYSPFEENKIIDNVWISNESISTSWIYARKWKIENKDYHHILNPFSNNQEFELLSVSIIDKYWYKTDSLATSIHAMWYEKWLEFVKTNNLKYIFVLKNWEIIKNIDF